MRFYCSFLLFFLLPFKMSFSFENVVLPMDLSQWVYKTTKLECSLVHSDPLYGKFYFRAEDNKKVNLILSLKKTENNWRGVVLSSQLPPWKEEGINIDHSPIIMATSKNQFAFNDGVDDILAFMRNGYWLSISLYNDEALSNSLRITLPVTGVQGALADFEKCREQLPKLSPSQARDVNLHFYAGQKFLSNGHKAKLRDVYNYMTKDKRVIKVLIDGHTDNTGDDLTNLTLSRNRAQQVADELVLRGVEREMIEVRAHGSRYPTASNSTKLGQAKNRRVILRLVRDNEQTVPVNSSKVKPRNKTINTIKEG
ncbi:sodium-type flagellar protein MotY [Vibrio sagamiensis NBRC 104589]|uniref:Sodium-type flagellar protein MotY n=2 Tax=Vibrio sagamiensis TaxID=512650 RepID=A0A511QD13_9VIBR|nr:sodium-type flagellar protein MotY [Vibrio sagamiensis NBRC 104589]